MSLLETLTLTLAPVIAKSILKMWLKDEAIAADTSSSLIDLLGKKVSDVVIRQSAKRQLEEVGEKVAIGFLPLMNEFNLPDTDRETVINAVSETIQAAKLSADFLTRNNLDPQLLYKSLLVYRPKNGAFSSIQEDFYQRILEQSASYIIDISELFPRITERSLSEILKREKELLRVAEFVLEEVQRIRSDSQKTNVDQNLAFFEENYRRSIGRTLDKPDIFGITNLSRLSQRYRISVAYISLSVIHVESQNHFQDHNRITNERQPVEDILARTNRIIIRGQAGSGKTTLLKWLAIHSANGKHEGLLEQWNNLIPFFVQLRKFVNTPLPAPEEFVKCIAPEIAATMPANWVHSCLASKRALILIDGVDEIPQAQRNQVREWIDGLIVSYPNANYVISSRPYAISEKWLDEHNFIETELQPMELQDIYEFIDNWHSAIGSELDDLGEKAELETLSTGLKEVITNNRSIFNIATNPLLCASICALHRDRHQHLPSSRIEVYEALCEMLLERREKERNLTLEGIDYPALSYLQKRFILEGIAYWMISNGYSSVNVDYLDRYIARRTKNIVGLPKNATEISIRRLLTERSGILREPTVGEVDFIHRTIQEFLAAKALLDNEDLGVLKANAHDDQWFGVIILASGLAGPRVREKIIKDILHRGTKEWHNRHKLYLIAVNCLENAIDLSPKLQDEIKQHLASIVPPRNDAEAAAIASAHNLAVPFLKRNEKYSIAESKACILALAKINSDEALVALQSYVENHTPGVADTLVMAGLTFDEELYFSRITAHLRPYDLSVSGMLSLNLINNMTSLRDLSVNNCTYLKDIQVIAEFSKLRHLRLDNIPLVSDLMPLLNLQDLESLELISLKSINNFDVLLYLPKLRILRLDNIPLLSNLEFITSQGNKLTKLWEQLNQLYLHNLTVTDLTPVEKLTNLSTLHLINIPIRSLRFVTKLENLRYLHLDKLSGGNLDDLVKHESLETIYLGNSFMYTEIPKKLRPKVKVQWAKEKELIW